MRGYKIFVNIAFVIGFAMNLVKAGDLVLLPHQQKRVQEFVNDLALRLSYLRGDELIGGYLQRHKPLFSSIAMLTSCFVVWPRAVWTYAPTWALVVAIGFGSLFSALVLIWTVEAGSVSARLQRAAIASGVPLFIGVVLAFSRGPIVVPQGGRLPLLSPENLTAYGILASLAATTVPTLGLALWLGSISVFVILLKLGEAAAWRVALYVKGAWAALMVLLTLILSVVAVFVNGK